MTELPAGWTTRRPTIDDVPVILALVHACDVAAVGFPDFSPDEVVEVLTAPNVDPSRDSWLALDAAGAVVGWAYLDNPGRGPRDFVEVYVHPERGLPAQRPLLSMILGRVAERATEFGLDQMAARAATIPTEAAWIASLRAAGFEFVKRHARMKRSLAGISPVSPVAPAGVGIRPVRPSDEADMREFYRVLDTAFRDTPDYEPTSYELWRGRIDALPSVAWDEWLVAEVDGVHAGILQSSGQDEEEGWVKHLAVLREHRNRGIGAALLAAAFAVYVGNGRQAAGLGVDLSNPTQAYRLYSAVGMHAAYETDIFERSIPAAPGED